MAKRTKVREIRKCLLCGKEFEVYVDSFRRFCSKECWYSSEKGKKRGKYNDSRVAAMACAKKAQLEKKYKWVYPELEKLISAGITNKSELARRLGISFSRLEDILKEPSLASLLAQAPKFPLTLQALDLETIKAFLEELKAKTALTRSEAYAIGSKYSLKNHVVESTIAALGLQFKKTFGCQCRDTLPEKIFERLLIDKNIPYMKQVILPRNNGQHYVIDFVIADSIAVEIHGDYWHGNPKIYKEQELNTVQLLNKARDIDKLLLMRARYPKVLVFWENELKSSAKLKRITEEICASVV